MVPEGHKKKYSPQLTNRKSKLTILLANEGKICAQPGWGHQVHDEDQVSPNEQIDPR